MEHDNLKKVIALLKKYHIELNPPVSVETVQQVEKQYNIILPKEYILFVTTVGNGGQLPRQTDSEGVVLSLEQCDLKNVSKLFTYKETHLWVDDNSKSLEQKQLLSENGHFAFMECADGFTWDLIVTGPRKGECWLFGADGMMRGKKLDFLLWISLYIQGTLTQWMADTNRKEETFDVYRIRMEKNIKRYKCRLNAPISVEEVQHLEETYGVTFPPDYVQFITNIGDGGELRILSNKGKTYCRVRSIRECNFSKISEPFPLNEIWRFGWDWTTKKVLYDIETDPEGKWADLQNGQFCFLDFTDRRGDRYAYSLILNGSQYGKVWVCMDNSILKATDSFQRWFDFFVHEHVV